MIDRSVKSTQAKEVRREALIDCAFRLFLERGFAATRLEDVAAAAGVAKGTVVSYFPSKDALFTSVIRHYLDPHLARAQGILAEPGPAPERLRALARFLNGTLCDGHVGGIPKMIVAEVGNFPELARWYHEAICGRFRALVAGIIAEGIAAGVFRRLDADLAARQFADPILMQAIWRHSLGRYDPAGCDPEAYLDQHLDTFLRGIAP